MCTPFAGGLHSKMFQVLQHMLRCFPERSEMCEKFNLIKICKVFICFILNGNLKKNYYLHKKSSGRAFYPETEPVIRPCMQARGAQHKEEGAVHGWERGQRHNTMLAGMRGCTVRRAAATRSRRIRATARRAAPLHLQRPCSWTWTRAYSHRLGSCSMAQSSMA